MVSFVTTLATKFYEPGHSLAEVAKMLDFGKTTVRMALKKAGVEMRPARKGKGYC